jgi:transcriptional regulator with XRE-family HTH domain
MASDVLRRYGAVLEDLLASKGMSRRAVENKLGWGRGTFTKILQGKNELKVGSLLEILRAMDVAPLDFYALVHGDAPSGEAPIVSRILKSFGPSEQEVESLTLPRNLGREELETLIESVVRRILAEPQA